MTNSVMASGLPKVRSGRKGLYILSIFIFLGAASVYGYSLVRGKYFASLIAEEQKKTAVLLNDIATAQKDERYLKYLTAKEIVTKYKVTGRGDRISRIMNVFAKLQQLGGANIRFNDFSLDYELLGLKGTVSDLKLVYGKGGVIDMFNELEFLEDIVVPSYQKTDDGFTFSLTAKVIINNVSN